MSVNCALLLLLKESHSHKQQQVLRCAASKLADRPISRNSRATIMAAAAEKTCALIRADPEPCYGPGI